MTNVTLGVDIGGTFTKYGIVKENGECLAEGSTGTSIYQTPEPFVENLFRELSEMINSLPEPVKIAGMGIGAPNGNYYNGTIENAANLNWKGKVPFVALCEKYFKDYPIVLTNDANAAAIGEMVFGNAKGLKNFTVITLGTGLGSGIVVNGELVYGYDGFAGEIGHVTVEKDGRECGFGRKGSLETYVSATGIKRTAFQLMADTLTPSPLRDIAFNDLTSYIIYEEARKGDELALQCFDVTAKYLGEALADTVAHLSPETIFIFGGLAKAGDLLLKPTKEYMEAHLIPIYKGKVKIELSGLQNVNAAVLGAAALAWNEIK